MRILSKIAIAFAVALIFYAGYQFAIYNATRGAVPECFESIRGTEDGQNRVTLKVEIREGCELEAVQVNDIIIW